MKLVACLAAFAATHAAFAEAAMPPTDPETTRRVIRPSESPAPKHGTDQAMKPAEKSLRFSLSFPGGKPAELAEAITKAQGQRLNLIVPEGQKDLPIGAFRIEQATVPQLLDAISRASAREVVLRRQPERGPSFLEKRAVMISFIPAGDPNDPRCVWALQSNAPTEEEIKAEHPTPPPVIRYFQLEPWLPRYSVEDVTTAIQTGWKMKGVDPAPKLSFHKETSLLIAVGISDDVQVIQEVLQSLPQGPQPKPDATPAP